MRVRQLDRTELLVVGVSFVPILVVAVVVVALDAPWWLLLLVVADVFRLAVWVLTYERRYQRRHLPAIGVEDAPAHDA